MRPPAPIIPNPHCPMPDRPVPRVPAIRALVFEYIHIRRALRIHELLLREDGLLRLLSPGHQVQDSDWHGQWWMGQGTAHAFTNLEIIGDIRCRLRYHGMEPCVDITINQHNFASRPFHLLTGHRANNNGGPRSDVECVLMLHAIAYFDSDTGALIHELPVHPVMPTNTRFRLVRFA